MWSAGVRVFFSRVPHKGEESAVWVRMCRSGIVEMAGGEGHFVDSVDEALRMSEMEELVEELAGRAGQW